MTAITLSDDRKENDIKDLMSQVCKHIKIDKKLLKALRSFRVTWLGKHSMYTEFLGGNLLGTLPIRFSSYDDELLMVETLGIDIDLIANNLEYIDGIVLEWEVSSNPIYITLVYLMHRVTVANIGTKLQTELLDELYYIFAYKVISSMIFQYFKKFTTPVPIAKAAFEKMPNKFILKRTGSWNGVFEHRTKDIHPKKGLHHDRLVKFDTEASIRMTNDLQGRIKGYVLNIYSVLEDIRKSNKTIHSQLATTTNRLSSDGPSVREVTTRPDEHLAYIRSIVGISNDFVDDDLVYVVSELVPTVEEKVLKETLVYLSMGYREANTDIDYLHLAIVDGLMYVNTKGIVSDYRSNIQDMVKLLRGYWGSSSVKLPALKPTKLLLMDYVTEATGRKTKWLVKSTVIGVLIYILLRAIVNKK